MPRVNGTTVAAALVGLLIVAWLVGLVRVGTEEGRARLSVGLARKRTAEFDFRDTWLSLGLVLILTWSIATALERSWVPGGSGRLPLAALVATMAGWLLAVSRLSRRGFMLAGLLVTAPYVVGSTLDAVHLGPNFDVGPVPAGFRWLALWGSATWFQSRFALLIGLITLVMLTGWWTSWWVFRRQAGLVALLPSGTVLAVEVLNDTSPSLIFFSLAWMASALLLLVRLHYVRLKERWQARRIPRSQDTPWTFGEVSFEAAALLLLIAFVLLPPLTSEDISSSFVPSSINPSGIHPFNFGGVFQTGPQDVGYSEQVKPGHRLRAKPSVVMSVSGEFSASYPYWRGVALGGWDGEGWYFFDPSSQVTAGQQASVPPRTDIARADLPDDPQRLKFVHNTFHVTALSSPATAFSAGELIWVSKHPISVRGMVDTVFPVRGLPTGPLPVNEFGQTVSFETVDQVHLVDNVRVPYDYTSYSVTSVVDEQSLRQAGTSYPFWVEPYRSLYYQNRIWNGGDTGRDADIARLALSIVQSAHAQNAYDQARAIEAWLRDPNRFKYTLDPKQAGTGVRQLDYFLFTTRSGYCQDFATAMAVMLRSLPDPVPVRVVNGYGLGTYEQKSQRYVVRATDAHTWVEVFFPGYGWQPLEPTPDGQNFPLNRAATPADLNRVNSEAPGNQGQVGVPGVGGPSSGIGAGISGPTGEFLSVGTRVAVGLAVLLLLVVLMAVVGVRWYLRPEDAPRVWRRLRFLGRQLEVPTHPGDTPNEYGAKLSTAVPPLAQEITTLARLFTRARYRQAGLDGRDTAELHQAWDRVRRRYPGLLVGALRDRVRNGRATAGGARASGSHALKPRRRAAGRSRGGSG